jgi:S-adenosylmethionine:tRNA ribosyltransferase-isomerase
MLVSDFDYNLPPELIAQHPVEPRHNSRLLHLQRNSGQISDHHFYDLPQFLHKGDLLVFNDTRVIPARLFARKEGEDGAKIEVFLLKKMDAGQWECLVRPGKRAKPGTELYFAGGVRGIVTDLGEEGSRIIQFPTDLDFRSWLKEHGATPLPPYITETLADPERYQTVYSKQEGSVAAPTAGLHFSEGLMAKIINADIQTGFLTLQVGLGTFRPVKTERVEEHPMHSESFILPKGLVEQIQATKAGGHRVIAVGTTVVRVLESQADPDGQLLSGSGETRIFIYPGYSFKVVDALITNFHLPKSTLLMLVSAFAGGDLTFTAYRHAVSEQYRFFSFGDAMFIE